MRKSVALLAALALCTTPAFAAKFQRGRVNINNSSGGGPQRGRVNITNDTGQPSTVTVTRHGLLGRPHTTTVTNGGVGGGQNLVQRRQSLSLSNGGGQYVQGTNQALSLGNGCYGGSYNQVVHQQLLAPSNLTLSTNRLNTFTTLPYSTAANLSLSVAPAYTMPAAELVAQAPPTVQQYVTTTTVTQPAPVVQQSTVAVQQDTSCQASAPVVGTPNANYLTAPPQASPQGPYQGNPALMQQNRQYLQNCR